MADIFDFHNDIPVLTPEAMMMPQFKKLRREHDQGDFDILVLYLFHAYSRKSTYFGMMPLERRQLVCKDQLKIKSGDWKKKEEMDGVKECIEILDLVQFNAEERLFYGMNAKIEEYLVFWQDTKIDVKNHQIVSDSLKNAAVLVKLRNELEQQIFKKNDDNDNGFGGAKKTRFEE